MSLFRETSLRRQIFSRSIFKSKTSQKNPRAKFTQALSALALLGATNISVSGFTLDDISFLQLRSPLPAAGSYRAIATGGTTVVMVTDKGEIASSFDDGSTWQRTAVIREFDDPLRFALFNDIILGGGNWLACSFGQELAISSDALTWEAIEFPRPFSPLYLAYFQNKYFGFDFSGRVFQSVDGREWTRNEEQIASNVQIRGAEAVANRLVVATNDEIYTSTDGLTWTLETIPSLDGKFITDLSYVASRFVAIGDNLLLTSDANGQNWQRASLPNEDDFDFRYAVEDPPNVIALDAFREFHRFDQNGVFLSTESDVPLLSLATRTEAGSLVGGYAFSELRRRAAGSSFWIDRQVEIGEFFRSVVYGAGRFVTQDASGGALFSSDDGAQWVFETSYETSQAQLVFGNGMFLTLDSERRAILSSDGLDWVTETTDLEFDQQKLFFQEGEFLALGFSGRAARSTNGITWTDVAVSDSFLTSIAKGDGLYVAVGNSSDLFTSSDFTNWTVVTAPSSENTSYTNVVYGNGRFVATGGNEALVSLDGSTWTVLEALGRPSANTGFGYDAELGFYNPGTGVVSTLGQEPDADTQYLTGGRYTANLRFNSLVEGDGVLVGVGRNGLIMSSSLLSSSVNYELWVNANFPDGTSDADTFAFADPDLDEVENLGEYALGSDPTVSDAPDFEITRTALGPELSFVTRARRNDVEELIEWSHDLESWSNDGVQPFDDDLGGGSTLIRGRLTGEDGEAAANFFRVRWRFQVEE